MEQVGVTSLHRHAAVDAAGVVDEDVQPARPAV